MKLLKRSIFSDEEKKRIGEAVALAEKRTSGEIVVRAVAQSGDYRWVYPSAMVKGWIVMTALALLRDDFWHSDPAMLIGKQFAGMLVGFLVVCIPAVRRSSLNKAQMALCVHEQAVQLFVESGTLKTVDRTGVLIYVSEFEHRVEILADVGIHSIVGDSYWKDQVDHIVRGIREKRACAAICEAVNEIGSKLAERFPPSAENPNELPNEPV